MRPSSLCMAVDDDDEAECTMVASRDELSALRAQLKAKARRPTLTVVAGLNSVGKTSSLAGEVVVGRHHASGFALDEEGISRRHAAFRVDPDGSVTVSDLGSTNGTFVNGERIQSAVLRDGDKIQLGGLAIVAFSFQDELDEEHQRRLYDSATRDALTHAYNRKHFADALPREIAFSRRHKRPLSVAIFDIDHFKRINDGHGHPAGDHVLVTLCARVASAIRTEDVFARIGGEEFALVLRDLDLVHGLQCAERVRALVESTKFVFEGRAIPVTISVGVAQLDEGHAGEGEIVAAADRALYAAKHGGRNRVEASKRAA